MVADIFRHVFGNTAFKKIYDKPYDKPIKREYKKCMNPKANINLLNSCINMIDKQIKK